MHTNVTKLFNNYNFINTSDLVSDGKPVKKRKCNNAKKHSKRKK